MRRQSTFRCWLVSLFSLCTLVNGSRGEQTSGSVPDWVADAVFYQIFPERFRNGDPTNDPTRESLENPARVPENWAVSAWTDDWYARSPWETQRGENFFRAVYDRRYGGDLQGVLDKLEYLQSLGVNTLYLNPVFYARSLHKYDASSMHHIDPYFGPDPAGDLKIIAGETADPSTWQWTAADRLFLRLVEAVHQRGMRIIIDGVFNHTGRSFFAFADLKENQVDSPYADWYIVEQWDDPATPQNEFRYQGWWGARSLPVWADNQAGNDLHPGPKTYVMQITQRWMDPNGDGNPSDGIDGWRLDVAAEVPIGFWREWNQLVRRINPEAYTVGEFWENAHQSLAEGEFSATMNYYGFAFPVKGFLVDVKLPASEFAECLETRRALHDDNRQLAMQNLIDSHDTPRVASMIVNAASDDYQRADRWDYDIGRSSPRRSNDFLLRGPNQRERQIQRLVPLLQCTYVGAPMIYYGTEAGMWGGDDPCDRMPMVWADLRYADQSNDPRGQSREPDPVAFDEQLFAFYQQLFKVRQENAALRRGGVEIVSAEDESQFLAFRRKLGEQSLLVVFNRGEQPFRWETEAGVGQLLFCTTKDKEPLAARAANGSSVLTVPALTGAVFVERYESN